MDSCTSELLIVSGYPALIDSIRDVCGELSVAPAIIEWEPADEKLIDTLTDMFRETGHPDVIISRGAVAEIIERAFTDIVVLRAEPDDVDLLEVLSDAARVGPRVGFLIYAQYATAFKTESIRRVLKLEELRPYPYRSKADIVNLIEQGRNDGMSVMVGGGKLGEETGQALGFPVQFVETGKRSIRNTIIQAMAIIEARRAEKNQLRFLKAVVASVNEGIVTLRDRKIVLANAMATAMLRLPVANVVDQECCDLTVDDLEPPLRRFILQSKTTEEVIRIRAQFFFCKKVRLSDSPVRGEVMLICRSVTDIQQQEQKIRRELHTKGFTARYTFADIICNSVNIRSLIDKASTFAETNANILICGESGTGKELFAQSVHNASSRRNRPFVAVNCAAIPETLLESELFGYEKGAFSGALRSGKLGLFELAHEGTIFLDEISSLPIALQGVLLRVIQEKQIRRVGSQSLISIDTRIISATNGNLVQLIGNNSFRSDLFYRLNTLHLWLPPLSERRDDIVVLTQHFLSKYAAQYNVPPPTLFASDLALLAKHPWCGNVRELENVIHRYVVLIKSGEGNSLRMCLDIPETEAAQPAGTDGDAFFVRRGTLAEIENQVVMRYLEEARWNKQTAADRLGICRATLWRKLKE